MRDIPTRSRGVIALIESNCTVCMICARECPDWCIHIESHAETEPAPVNGPSRRPIQRSVLDRFAIDYGQCMYCGICVEVCPFDALHWVPDYSYAGLSTPDGQDATAALVQERDVLGTWISTEHQNPTPAAD